MLNRRELSEKLHRRNAAQVAYNNGEIEEEYLKNALDKAMKGVEVEEMGGDYFEPIIKEWNHRSEFLPSTPLIPITSVFAIHSCFKTNSKLSSIF